MTTASPSCLPSCFLLLLLPSLVSAGRHSSLVRRLTGVSLRGGSLISSHISHSSLLASHPSLSLTVCQDVGPVNKVLEVGDARANGVSNTSTLATRRQWTWAAQHTAHSTARPPCHTQRGQRCQFSSSCCNFHSVKTSLCVCVTAAGVAHATNWVVAGAVERTPAVLPLTMSTAPANSNTAATSSACRIVNAFAPTDGAKVLATSCLMGTKGTGVC